MSRITPTDEELGQLVRRAAWAAASRTSTTGAARDQVVIAAVKAQYPKAMELLDEATILASTRNLGPKACSWCAAAQIAGHDLEVTPARRAALGSMCGRCRGRLEARKVAQREAAHIKAVTAAGLKPEAASRYRSAKLAQRVAAEVETLKRAPLKRGR